MDKTLVFLGVLCVGVWTIVVVLGAAELIWG